LRNFTTPAVGFTSPPITLRTVDFPQPDGPVIITNSFLWVSKFMSMRTGMNSFSFL